MSLEKIVRPFQLTDVFTARVSPPEIPATEEPSSEPNSVLEWAGSAEAKWEEEPAPATLGFTVEWTEDKSRRVTETVRVTNPDDDDQFIDVERIQKMVLKNNRNGEEIPIKLDWK
jgi:hypothetical protein